MSYQVKRTIVSVTTGILILAAYYIYVLQRLQWGDASLSDAGFWAVTMLVFIGIGVAASIVIQIVFHILLSIALAVKEQMKNGKCDDKKIERELELQMVEDEMDRLIGLKSMRVAFAVAGAGFIGALISLALGQSIGVMLNILFASFSVGSILNGAAHLYFYKRGIKNGKEI